VVPVARRKTLYRWLVMIAIIVVAAITAGGIYVFRAAFKGTVDPSDSDAKAVIQVNDEIVTNAEFTALVQLLQKSRKNMPSDGPVVVELRTDQIAQRLVRQILLRKVASELGIHPPGTDLLHSKRSTKEPSTAKPQSDLATTEKRIWRRFVYESSYLEAAVTRKILASPALRDQSLEDMIVRQRETATIRVDLPPAYRTQSNPQPVRE